jgi:hypothetical protein
VNGSLRQLEKRETELRQTPLSLAQAEVARSARKLDPWLTSGFCEIRDRTDRVQVSLRNAGYLPAIECVAGPRGRKGWL